MRLLSRLVGRLRSEHGFTMFIVMGVMLVTSMLIVAAFTSARGDVDLSQHDSAEKQAYYAALAGVQQFEDQLEANPDYWQKCEAPASSASEETTTAARYEVVLKPAKPKLFSSCNTEKPFESMIRTQAPLANTFTIESVGCAGVKELVAKYASTCSKLASKKVEEQLGKQYAVHRLVATFQVTGFLDYVYYTNYEDEDPKSYNGDPNCKNYRPAWEKLGAKCVVISFAVGDNVNGPMHTNDEANIAGTVEFGRKVHEDKPFDKVEIDKGVVEEGGAKPTYNTESGKYEKGTDFEPPETDASLKTYVEPANHLYGRTELELKGTEIQETTWNEKTAAKEVHTVAWPKNGLIYVQSNEKGCGYTEFEQEHTDTTKTYEEEINCGSVYVKGDYSKSLTIAGEEDLIINGDIKPEGTTSGEAPTGTAVLGLIASRFVRVYHPCTSPSGAAPTLEEPWIYAAILSTGHSFLVDNSGCGGPGASLNVYGAIAQNFRGIVGTFNGASATSGYPKDYKYDERLATEEPPYYLSPLKAGWKIVRLTTA